MSLNFQTRDEGLMLYDGWFEDNGGCGYVLKPDFMRSPDTEFGQYLPQPSDWKRVLTVRVISGYLIPKEPGDSNSEIVDPYVQVWLLQSINQFIEQKDRSATYIDMHEYM